MRTRALAGCPQTHVVLGFPLPALGGAHQAGVVAAALLGEGMSSPLMDQLRERRGLVYYAACSADVLELAGQFVIEASTSPQQLQPFFAEVVRLLLEHAAGRRRGGAASARAGRSRCATCASWRSPRAGWRRPRSTCSRWAACAAAPRRCRRLQDVSAEQVREAFATMLHGGASIAVAGKLPRGHDAQLRRMGRAAAARLSAWPAGIV